MGTTFQHTPEFSVDGMSYWDGTSWRSLLSADGRNKWNGREWIPLELSDVLELARSPGASVGAVETAAPSNLGRKSVATPRLRANIVRAFIVLLVISTAAVALLASNAGRSGSKNQTGPSDSDRVAYLLLTPLEVGSNWTLAAAAADGPDRLAADRCLLKTHGYTAGSSASYGFVPEASGRGQIYVMTAGRISATATAASEVDQAIGAGVDDRCLASTFADYAWNCGCRGGAVSVGQPVLRHLASPPVVDGKAVEGVQINGDVPLETPSGHWTLSVDLIRLRRGRLETSLVFASTDPRSTWASLETRLTALAERRLITAHG